MIVTPHFNPSGKSIGRVCTLFSFLHGEVCDLTLLTLLVVISFL